MWGGNEEKREKPGVGRVQGHHPSHSGSVFLTLSGLEATTLDRRRSSLVPITLLWSWAHIRCCVTENKLCLQGVEAAAPHQGAPRPWHLLFLWGPRAGNGSHTSQAGGCCPSHRILLPGTWTVLDWWFGSPSGMGLGRW
jgi:hypothetical protein